MTGTHAGGSAEGVARRHREKIARLERSAANWEAGAAGERLVGEVLDRLRPAGWTVLHDVPWPGRSRANIDHVVVGPGGVFVVDAKNWSGRVQVRDGKLLQNGHSRHRELSGVAEATVAVMRFHPRVPTHAVLCLVGEEPRRELAGDVTVCSSASLLDVVRSATGVLTPEQVTEVAQGLASRLTRSQPVFEAPPRATRRSGRRGPTGSARRRSTPSLSGLVGFLVVVGLMVGFVQTGLPEPVRDFVTGLVTTDTGDRPSGPKDRPVDRQRDRAQR